MPSAQLPSPSHVPTQDTSFEAAATDSSSSNNSRNQEASHSAVASVPARATSSPRERGPFVDITNISSHILNMTPRPSVPRGFVPAATGLEYIPMASSNMAPSNIDIPPLRPYVPPRPLDVPSHRYLLLGHIQHDYEQLQNYAILLLEVKFDSDEAIVLNERMEVLRQEIYDMHYSIDVIDYHAKLIVPVYRDRR